MDKIRDWKRQWAQLVVLLLSLIHPFFLDLPKIIIGLLTQAEIAMKDLEVISRLAISFGKWVLAAVIFVFLTHTFRKQNQDIVIKQSIPNKIVWHTFFGYCFCRKALNYKKINLTRVPIPVQFQLICSDLFDEYQYDSVTKLESGNDYIKKEVFNNDCYTSTVNMVLADTYPLSWKEQLPADYLKLTTVKIDRSSENRNRYHSVDFVKEVVSTIRNLPQNVVEINLFGTLNPAHCLDIAREGFMTGGRDHIRKLNVFQQSAEGARVFTDKKVEISI